MRQEATGTGCFHERPVHELRNGEALERGEGLLRGEPKVKASRREARVQRKRRAWPEAFRA